MGGDVRGEDMWGICREKGLGSILGTCSHLEVRFVVDIGDMLVDRLEDDRGYIKEHMMMMVDAGSMARIKCNFLFITIWNKLKLKLGILEALLHLLESK